MTPPWHSPSRGEPRDACLGEPCSRGGPALATGKRRRRDSGMGGDGHGRHRTRATRCAASRLGDSQGQVEEQRPHPTLRWSARAIGRADGRSSCGAVTSNAISRHSDGRLGRSRSAGAAPPPRLVRRLLARVERLRQFERDTQRRFRTPEQTSSVWEGLELDLVGSNGAVGGGRLLAAPRGLLPARRRARPGAVGTTTRRRPATGGHAPAKSWHCIAARGRTRSRWRSSGLSAGSGRDRSGSRRNRRPGLPRLSARSAAPMLSSDDAQVADWLAVELGRPVPLPPVPDGYRLIGATHADLAGGVAGVLIYAQTAEVDAAPVMLFVRPTPMRPVIRPRCPSSSAVAACTRCGGRPTV